MNVSAQARYDEIVEALVPIWSELLKNNNLTITEETDFFESGGHSLLAMLLMNKVKTRFGKSVPLFALVDHSTVGAFSEYLLKMDDSPVVDEAPAPDGSASQTERLLGYNNEERRNRRNKWFEQYYATAMSSRAHAEFCRRVYGENYGQHGMADTQQINKILQFLQPKPGDVILDMGCGYGLISQYIADKTGAKVVGVDLSPSAIRYAQDLAKNNSKLEFHVMDIKDLSFPENHFTHIISIDTVYYAPSLERLLETLRKIGTRNLKLAILRTFPIRSFTKETWDPDRTELASLLRNTFGTYETDDLSQAENEHWRNKLAVLGSLKDAFLEEGNEELFDFRHREAEYEAAIEQFRYLFVSELGQ